MRCVQADKITHSLYHALLEIKCIPVGLATMRDVVRVRVGRWSFGSEILLERC